MALSAVLSGTGTGAEFWFPRPIISVFPESYGLHCDEYYNRDFRVVLPKYGR
jgi:hypothetical protein